MSEGNLPKRPQVTDRIAENISRVEELAYELKIGEVMTRDIITASPSMRMEELVEIFRKRRISGSPVLENDQLVGIISIEDVIHSLRAFDMTAEVRKYMTSEVISVRNTDPVIEGLKKFVGTSLGRLPVVDEYGHCVGILTKGDVTRGLLKALQRDIDAEELIRYRASHLFEDIESDRSSLILRYNIKAGDFIHGGTASSNIKRALIRMGANPKIARRVGIAVYEAEMNLIIHTTHGGVIRVEIEPHQISMDVYDDGPGIPDIDLAMKPGYSTATEAIRELGFGAGMGLVNISRCVDQMKLESVVGKGTRLKLKIFLKEEDKVGEGYPESKESKDEPAGNH
jgi:CBS domain-containing protein/anti-sigma regulatory factor (Ser/Thr protein kinase)